MGYLIAVAVLAMMSLYALIIVRRFGDNRLPLSRETVLNDQGIGYEVLSKLFPRPFCRARFNDSLPLCTLLVNC
jgi:hypothetical protein